MRVTIKLFASLARYLPQGSRANEAQLDAEDDVTVGALLTRLHVPGEHCHLVLLNGAFVEPRRRAEAVLHDGDELAVWPQVAGG